MTAVCVLRRATRRIVTPLLAMSLLGAGAIGISGQEPPDSVVPLDSVVVTVTRGSDGLGRTPFAVSVQGRRPREISVFSKIVAVAASFQHR